MTVVERVAGHTAGTAAAPVLIIGGGLAGASAALALHDQGIASVIVEARGRLGGRASSHPLPGGASNELVEFGGGWIAPWHDRVRALAARLDQPLRATTPMIDRRWHDGEKLVHGSEPRRPPIEPALAAIAADARQLHAGTDDGSRLLTMSLTDYLGTLDACPAARREAMAWWTISGSGDPAKVPAYDLVHFSSHHDHGLDSMLDVMTHTLADGIMGLAQGVAEASEAVQILGDAVVALDTDNVGVMARLSSGRVVRGQHAIVAVAANSLRHLGLRAPVTGAPAALSAGVTHGGRAIKLLIRARGVTPGTLATGDIGGWRWFFADRHLADGDTMIVGFGLYDECAPPTRESVGAAIAAYFAEAQFIGFDWHDWIADPWSSGTWVAPLLDEGALFDASAWAMQGRIAFASGDFAATESGWFEGAVRSGEAAAASIINAIATEGNSRVQTQKFYIGGSWVDPISDERLAVINPATEAEIAIIAMGCAADVDAAVKAARDAFPSFAQTSRDERLALLRAIRSAYEERYDDIVAAVSAEMGAPMSFARDSQAWVGIAHLDATIKALETLELETLRGTTRIVREPIGVVAMITPWNWPLNQILTKVAPAIAAGCTMVLKPSEIAPLSALVFAEVMAAAGVPAGVFNLVNGDGPTVGQALAAHPQVDAISFTGSTRAGIAVAKAAADTVKRVSQELGGKSANIILDDADLDAAVTAGVESCFANSGQSCDAPTRMLVPAARHAEALEIARIAAEAHVVGDPADDDTALGPVVSALQFSRIQAHIDAGIAEGATLVAGGPGLPDGIERGYFVRPTVFGGVTPAMSIAREEIFGPVLAIMPYADEAAAISIANDTPYGLSSYVQSGDLVRARAVARQLRAGQVHINGPDWDTHAPFGGYKQSGNGREYADFGIREFLEVKAMLGYGDD